jgi:hypothetical protein
MTLPGGLLDALLFLGVLCWLLLGVLLGLLFLVLLLGVLLGLLFLVLLLGVLLRLRLFGLLLGMLLWLLLLRLALLLGMLLWLLLFGLALLLGMLLWLLLFGLALLLSMLLWLRLSVLRLRLFLLLFWLGLLFSLLSEGWNDRSEGHNQDCGSESCKCFHENYLNYSVGSGAANNCIVLTSARWTKLGRSLIGHSLDWA